MSYLDEIIKKDQKVNPLFSLLGIRAAVVEPGRAVLELPFRPGLVQGAGVVAGGVLSTLLDEAMAHAAIATINLDARGQETTSAARCATIEMSVRFLAPVRPGQDLRAEATVIKHGASVLFLESEATAGDRLVAKATASFLVRPAPCQSPSDA